MHTLDYASSYTRAGISVIPVKADGSKSPAENGWRKYSNQIADSTTLERWFGGPAPVGLGAVPGPASGNLVVLDFECVGGQSAYAQWYASLPPALQAVVDCIPLVQTPSGGMHLWVRLAEPQPGAKLARFASGKTKIEIRGEGHQVLAPGCPAECHRAGKLYEWVKEPARDSDGAMMFPVLVDEHWADMLAAAAGCNEYSPPDQPRDRDREPVAPSGVDSPGSCFNRDGTWEETGLFDAGWTWARRIGDDRGFLTRPGKDEGISASVGMVSSKENGYPYLYIWSTSTDLAAETPYSKFAVFAYLCHRGDFAAAAKSLREKGYGKDPYEDIDLSNLSFRVTKPDGTSEPAADTPESVDTWCVPSSALRAQADDARWLWRGFLARGKITLFNAMYKAGKSTIIGHLLKAMDGSRTDFLGYPVAPGKVLVISEEDEGLCADRRDELGLGDHVWWKIQPMEQRKNLAAWSTFIAEAVERVGRYQFDLVVIDTISKVWPVADENAAAQVEAALVPLWKVTSTGAAVMIVHHTRKSGGEHFTASRGSGGLPAFADIILEYRRFSESDKKCPKRIMEGTGRYRNTPKKQLIELTDEGYVNHGDPDDSDVRVKVKTFDWEETLREVMTEAKESETPLTFDQIKDAIASKREGVSVKNSDLISLLGKWFEGGELERLGTGRKGDPYLFIPA
jgi:hypothetical protein